MLFLKKTKPIEQTEPTKTETTKPRVDEYRCGICGSTVFKVVKDDTGTRVEFDNVSLAISEIELLGARHYMFFICRDCFSKLTQYVINTLRQYAELEDVDYLGILDDDVFPYRLAHVTTYVHYYIPTWEVYTISNFKALLKIAKVCRNVFAKSFIYYLEVPGRIECSYIPKRLAVYYLTMIPQDIVRHKVALRVRIDSVVEHYLSQQRKT